MMPVSTYFSDAIATTGAQIGVLFPESIGEFLIRPPEEPRLPDHPNKEKEVSRMGQEPKPYDVVVRLPKLRVSKEKIRVLQRWTGVVELVETDRFFAVLRDETDARNPLEEAELEFAEVSRSDRSLVVEGATFYWFIGYRDTVGGQRERISTLRFARLPRLSDAERKVLFELADRTAALLESA